MSVGAMAVIRGRVSERTVSGGGMALVHDPAIGVVDSVVPRLPTITHQMGRAAGGHFVAATGEASAGPEVRP